MGAIEGPDCERSLTKTINPSQGGSAYKKQLDPRSLDPTLPCSDEVLSALVQHAQLSEKSYLFQYSGKSTREDRTDEITETCRTATVHRRQIEEKPKAIHPTHVL
jgi:hypothetical protein